MKLEIEKIRERIVAALTARHDEASRKASDPYWTSGRHTPQKWVASALNVARHHVLHTKEEPGEATAAFFRRVADVIRAGRDHGSDYDDEAWYSSATDEASLLVSSIAHDMIATGPSAQVGTDSGPVG